MLFNRPLKSTIGTTTNNQEVLVYLWCHLILCRGDAQCVSVKRACERCSFINSQPMITLDGRSLCTRDSSVQETALHKRRQLCTGDSSAQETALYRRQLCTRGDSSVQETALYRRQLCTGDSSFQATALYRKLLSWKASLYSSLYSVQQPVLCTVACTLYSSLYSVQQPVLCTAELTKRSGLMNDNEMVNVVRQSFSFEGRLWERNSTNNLQLTQSLFRWNYL